MKKAKKTIKIKNKKILIPIILVIIICISISSFIIYKTTNNNALKTLKKNYNEYVITTSKTKLYDSNKKQIGTISKGYKLHLEPVKELTTKNKYLKIKYTNNYIDYKTIKKTEKFERKNNNNNLVLNKNIKSKNKTKLIQNNKVIITLNSINHEIEYIDDNYYYIKYLNDIFQIKKNKNLKVINHNNNKDKETEFVSVIHFEKISTDLDSNNCIDSEIAKEEINTLIDNGYYSITKEQYKMFLKGNIRLKEKAIFITTNEDNDNVKNIINELKTNISVITDKDNLKFESTNKKSTKDDNKEKLNRYQIKTYSSIDNILKMANGEEVIETEPPKNPNQSIAVLNYHFFYDSSSQVCNESICLTTDKFREHLQYLKDNNYKTLTMKEFANWMYGKIELPEKSVLITVDDGAMGTGKHNGNHLITLLEEYKMHATLFLIAGWWDISNYESKYLDVQSHTFDMHEYGPCGKGLLVCANYEEAKANIQKSLDIIKDNTSFCYPFYSYDDESIQAIKDLGIKVAFVGGNRKAKRSDNKYLIPRYPIISDITLQDFINKIS